MRFLTQNLLWKFLALAAAFGVWVNVASEPELATIASAPVEYKNFPNGLEISSRIVESIQVEARGTSEQLRNLHDSRISAMVDFGSVKGPGERTFTISASDLNLPIGIKVMRTIPGQLRFRFERTATRAVSVDVPFSGKLPSGFSVSGTEVEPRELRIAGPESHVNASVKLISDPFDLTDVTGDGVQQLSVYAADPEVRIVNAPRVRVKIRVQRRH